jgi:hypothetical protein
MFAKSWNLRSLPALFRPTVPAPSAWFRTSRLLSGLLRIPACRLGRMFLIQQCGGRTFSNVACQSWFGAELVKQVRIAGRNVVEGKAGMTIPPFNSILVSVIDLRMKKCFGTIASCTYSFFGRDLIFGHVKWIRPQAAGSGLGA